jgi:hypothetical protein
MGLTKGVVDKGMGITKTWWIKACRRHVAWGQAKKKEKMRK